MPYGGGTGAENPMIPDHTPEKVEKAVKTLKEYLTNPEKMEREEEEEKLQVCSFVEIYAYRPAAHFFSYETEFRKKAEKHSQRIQHGKKGRGEQLLYHNS